MKDFSQYGQVEQIDNRPKVSAMEAAARGAVDAPLFGFSGELGFNDLIGGIGTAYARTARPELFEDQPVMETWEQGRDISANVDKYALEDQPLAYMAGGAIPSIASSIGLSKLFPKVFGLAPQGSGMFQRARSLAKVGAAEGALAGAGTAEGDFVDRATGAGIGAAAGGLLSPIAGEATRGIARGVGSVIGRNLPTNVGGTKAERFLGEEVYNRPDILNRVPEARQTMERAAERGVTLTPAEALNDEALMATQGVVKTMPGEGAAKAQALREQRQTQELPQAFERQIQDISPMRSPDEAGRMLIQEAQGVESQVRKELSDKAAPFYQKAYQQEIPKDSSVLNAPRVQDYLKSVRSEFPELADKPSNSIEVLDEVKRMMDFDIQSAKGGASPDLNKARLISRAKSQLVNVMDEASPDYKQARAIYAEGAPEIEDIVKGRIGAIGKQKAIKEPDVPKQLIAGSAEQTQEIARKFSPEATQAGAAGILRSEQGKVRGEAFDSIQKRIFNTPQQQEQFKALLGEKYEPFAELMDVMQRVGKGQRFLEGSPTQPRQQAAAKLEDFATDAINNKQGFIDKVMKAFFGKSPEVKTAEDAAFYNELADLVLTPRGLDVIESIAETKPTIEQARKLLEIYQRGAVAATTRPVAEDINKAMEIKPIPRGDADFSEFGE